MYLEEYNLLQHDVHYCPLIIKNVNMYFVTIIKVDTQTNCKEGDTGTILA